MINLKILNLSRNKLRGLSINQFKSLCNLEKLYLNGNLINSLSNGNFLGLDSLSKLDLRDNLIIKLGADSFQGLSKLKNLRIRLKDFEYLRGSFFKNLENLSNLVICFSPETRMDMGSFAFLDNLELLVIGKRYQKNNFEFLKGPLNLKRLCIMVRTIEPNLITYLNYFSQLEALEIDIETLRNSHLELLGGLLHVKELNIRGCSFHMDVDFESFQYLKDIQKTCLNYKSIELTMCNQIFSTLKFTDEIDELPYNFKLLTEDIDGLTEIDKTLFNNFKSLEKLDLCKCNIKSIEMNTFSELSNLKELLLKGNKIEILVKGAFNGLDSLQKLDLSDNQINTIEINTFPKMLHLEELDLSFNRLNKIYSRQFKNILKSLKFLYVAGNPFTSIQDDLLMEFIYL